jgi:hypothetical protein
MQRNVVWFSGCENLYNARVKTDVIKRIKQEQIHDHVNEKMLEI